MPPLLQLRDIALTLGGEPLLEKAELSISPGERIAPPAGTDPGNRHCCESRRT
jgi:hypothetical protein